MRRRYRDASFQQEVLCRLRQNGSEAPNGRGATTVQARPSTEAARASQTEASSPSKAHARGKGRAQEADRCPEEGRAARQVHLPVPEPRLRATQEGQAHPVLLAGLPGGPQIAPGDLRGAAVPGMSGPIYPEVA